MRRSPHPARPIATGAPPGPAAFSCKWSASGLDAAWVRVTGELDLATTPCLARTLRGAVACAQLIVLDLRRVDFMDSAGAILIARVSRSAAARRRRLLILRAPEHVHRVFALTGTADDVEVVELHSAEPPVQALLKLAPDPPWHSRAGVPDRPEVDA